MPDAPEARPPEHPEAALEAIAEAIEDEEHATLLRKLDCAFGQGYLYARPGRRPGGDDRRGRGLTPALERAETRDWRARRSRPPP